MKKLATSQITLIGVLSAVTMMLGLTPLGFIPIGFTTATIMHIPVIIGAIMAGPVVGGFIGLIFGFSSVFYAIMNPNIISYVFLNPFVSVLPRILIGIVAAYTYQLISKVPEKKLKILMQLAWYGIAVYLAMGIYSGIRQYQAYSIIMNSLLLAVVLIAIFFAFKKSSNSNFNIFVAAIIGTLTNTVFVLGIIYVFYGAEFVEKIGGDSTAAGKAILTLGLVNGVPETIVAIILTTAVVVVLKKKH